MQIDNAELRARIELLEDPANQGETFDRSSWMQLVLGCIVAPVIILIWGF